MALQMDWTDEQSGLSVVGAYHRVAQVILDYDRLEAHLLIQVYASADARRAGKQPLPGVVRHAKAANIPATEAVDDQAHAEFDAYFGDAVFTAGKTDARRQAYLWLKATRAKAYAPLYAGALDV